MASILPNTALVSKSVIETKISDEIEGLDEFHMPTFAFHGLDYIPSGYGGILAPYIETGPGTMRAAATLMQLDLPPKSNKPQVICDLGCGDGEFLIRLLTHINRPSQPPISGFGIDYNAPLIATATLNAISANQEAKWLVYDFNLDEEDLFSRMVDIGVTHVFVYLVPRQLVLKTVRKLLSRLCESEIMVCCHKFQPGYLIASRRDVLMDLVVYEGVLNDE